MTSLTLDGLLGVDFVVVVMVVFAAEKERELGIVLLLGLGHVFELRTIASNKLR